MLFTHISEAVEAKFVSEQLQSVFSSLVPAVPPPLFRYNKTENRPV